MSTSNARPGRSRTTCGTPSDAWTSALPGSPNRVPDEPRRPHRDRVRPAVERAGDRDPALGRRLEQLLDLVRRGCAAGRPRRTATSGAVTISAAPRRAPRSRRARGRARPRSRVGFRPVTTVTRSTPASRTAPTTPASSAAHQLGRARRGAARRRAGSSGRWPSTARARGRPCREPTPARMLTACSTGPSKSFSPRHGACAPGPVVTYSPKVFIPLTKLCRDVCHYCTFARPPRRGERAYLTPGRGARHRPRRRRGRLHARRSSRSATSPSAATASPARSSPRSAARRRSSTSARMCELVLEETGLLPHANPGVMTRDELAALREVTASQGIMLETDLRPALRARRPALRLAGQAPGRAARDAPPRRRAARPVHDRDPDRDRRDPRGADRGAGGDRGAPPRARPHPGGDRPELPREAGHEDGRPPRAVARRPALDGGGRAARPPARTSTSSARRTSATTTSRACSTPGIDDWGGVSPVTIDHVNPEAPWPEIERLRAGDRGRRARARAAAAGLPGVPERPLARAARAHRRRSARPTPTGSRARTAGSRAPRRRCRSRRATLCRSTLPASSARTRSSASSPHAARSSTACFAAADALRREVNGDEVSYVVTRNVNYTNVCYFSCGFCAFSKGKLAENLRGPAYVVPTEEIVRRAHEAWERGAVEICLQGGIHPGFDGDYYVEVCEAIKRELPDLHVHAFSALEVWQGAATLGEPLDDVPRPPARRRPRLAPRHGRRDPRRRGPRGPLPGQGEHRAVARGARDRAPGRAALDGDDHVRARRHAQELGAAPAAHPRAPAAHGRVHRARPAAVRAHGGADLAEGPRALGADVPRGAAGARGRTAGAPSAHHEHPGLLGEARALPARSRACAPA